MRRRISIRGCVRPSVGPSVGRSVRRSVRPTPVIFKRVLGASCAVYPALFFQLSALPRSNRLRTAAAFLSAGWGGEEGIVGELQELQKQMNLPTIKCSVGKYWC